MKPTFFYRIKDAIRGIGASLFQLAPDKNTAISFAHKHINQEPERMIDANRYSI